MRIFKYLRISIAFILLFIGSIYLFYDDTYSSVVASKAPTEVNSLIKNVKLGSANTYKDMTVYPLILSNVKGDEFYLLDKSIKDGTLEIKEIGSGNVNTLKIKKNDSKLPVFIMAGEIVQGAKQDRTISNDLVLGKDSKTYDVAVYCVEQGRWENRSEKFDSAGVMGSQKLRSAVVQNKSQSEVWNEVSKKNRSLGASSSTSNYRASYSDSKYKDKAESYVNHFIKMADENNDYVGAIVEIDGQVANMDLFTNHDLFAELWPKLIKSYAQDAIDEDFKVDINKYSSLKVTPNLFINSLYDGDYDEISNPGLGNEYTIKTKHTSGSVLTYNNEVVHIALFADSGNKEKPVPLRNNEIQQNNVQQYQNIPNINRRR